MAKGKRAAKRPSKGQRKPKATVTSGTLSISSPGDGNPCYTVNPSGQIRASGIFEGAQLLKVVAAVVPGAPFPVPSTPSGISATEEGFIGPGFTWNFDVTPSGTRLVPGATGGCTQNTLLVWGTFRSGYPPYVTNVPFLGDDGTGSCSGVLSEIRVPAFELAPAQYAISVPQVRETLDSAVYRNGGPVSYPIAYLTDGSTPAAPIWQGRFSPPKRRRGRKTEPYLEALTLQVLREGRQLVAVLASRERDETLADPVRFHHWTCRGWNFTGVNYLIHEPYGARSPYPPLVVRPG
jgi:hypothetical protein